MLLWMLTSAGLISAAVVACQTVITITKNLLGRRLFKRKSPGLPVLPNPSIFSGHANRTYWRPDNWKNVDNYHKLYGPTFGWFNLDEPAVSTVDLDLIKTILLDEQNDHINRVELTIPIKELREDDIAFARDEQWWRLRKAFAPAFTNHRIMSSNVQEEINEVTNRFISSIELKLDRARCERGGHALELNADDIFCRYSTSLVFSCFYKQDDIIDFDSEEDVYLEMIDGTFQNAVNPLLKICPILPILIPIVEWFILHFRLQGRMIRTIIGFIKQQTLLNLKAKQHIQRVSRSGQLKEGFDGDNFIMEDGTRFRRNMIDRIIDQFHAGKLSESEYMNSTFFLFLAATKTTGDAISRLVYNLAAHQNVQIRLRETILTEGVNSEYLHWCVNESLRLFPPVTSGGSRIITRDIETKAGLIPSGSWVLVPSFTVHRLKEVWGPDADEFKPDRWENAKNFHPAQYLSFSLGKRNCLGKDFALNVIKKLIVTMILKYEFLPSEKTTAESVMKFGSPGYIYINPETPTYIKLRRM